MVNMRGLDEASFVLYLRFLFDETLNEILHQMFNKNVMKTAYI